MKILKNKLIWGVLVIFLMFQSCKFSSPIDMKRFQGIYVANTSHFIDTLKIDKSGKYFHAFHDLRIKFDFFQVGSWRPTVKNYYELTNWRIDSSAISGADIFPTINTFTGKISFAYPLITPEDVEYEKK
jgi:hypothetical protein